MLTANGTVIISFFIFLADESGRLGYVFSLWTPLVRNDTIQNALTKHSITENLTWAFPMSVNEWWNQTTESYITKAKYRTRSIREENSQEIEIVHGTSLGKPDVNSWTSPTNVIVNSLPTQKPSSSSIVHFVSNLKSNHLGFFLWTNDTELWKYLFLNISYYITFVLNLILFQLWIFKS
jgi:hypothetical protein